MAHRNRVTPFGEIVADPARGTMLGNRGVIHDAAGRIRRPWSTTRWICCRLSFKGWWRPVMQPNRWTHLFFLDEAVAIAEKSPMAAMGSIEVREQPPQG